MIQFVGAGPGAEDLITVRGAKLLEQADVVVYAGSLVNPAHLARTKQGCQIYDSASMTLEQVMDVMIPGTDGRMVCRELRRQSDVPVIMLTCLDSEFDEVTAMNLGADDYLTKPYRPALLLAHVRAALRRKAPEARAQLSVKGVTLDIGSGMAAFNDKSTQLTRNEARILALLMRSEGSAVSRAEIMCDLWESDAFVDDNTLTVNVNRLRNSLQSIGVPVDFIATRRGEGYLV